MERIDTVVIGAGVIGLAVARELALAGHEIVIVEAGKLIGSVTSARNSEVIHAGIYYPAGSLKARLCVAGRRLLYEYCERHHVPYRRCGKLLVATSEEQIGKLDGIRAHAAANGVDDLELISQTKALELEPALRCRAALVSPSTAIIDSHTYLHSLLGEARDQGAMLALASRVLRGALAGDNIVLDIASEGSEPMTCPQPRSSMRPDSPRRPWPVAWTDWNGVMCRPLTSPKATIIPCRAGRLFPGSSIPFP